MQTFAHFGSTPRHSVPVGGFCISVFAILRKGRKVLLLKAKESPRWMEEWAPNWRVYEPEKLQADMKQWRFPSSYIREGESPDDTLARVMKDQLGLARYKVRSSKLLNFYEPSSRVPGAMHWDYCFVYQVATTQTPRANQWLAQVGYFDPRSLSREEFGSSQGDLAKALKLV